MDLLQTIINQVKKSQQLPLDLQEKRLHVHCKEEWGYKLSHKPSKPTDWTGYCHSPDGRDHDAWSDLPMENLPSPHLGGAAGGDDDNGGDDEDNEDEEVGSSVDEEVLRTQRQRQLLSFRKIISYKQSLTKQIAVAQHTLRTLDENRHELNEKRYTTSCGARQCNKLAQNYTINEGIDLDVPVEVSSNIATFFYLPITSCSHHIFHFHSRL
jgi:hypothetical protein